MHASVCKGPSALKKKKKKVMLAYSCAFFRGKKTSEDNAALSFYFSQGTITTQGLYLKSTRLYSTP